VTTTTDCPPWCAGGHGPRFAHTGRANAVFGVIARPRKYHGETTVSLTLDADRKDGSVSLDLEELTRVIGMLTTTRDQLARAERLEA